MSRKSWTCSCGKVYKLGRASAFAVKHRNSCSSEEGGREQEEAEVEQDDEFEHGAHAHEGDGHEDEKGDENIDDKDDPVEDEDVGHKVGQLAIVVIDASKRIWALVNDVCVREDNRFQGFFIAPKNIQSLLI
jgi:hypothetical protein